MLSDTCWGRLAVFVIAMASMLTAPVDGLSQELPKVTVRRVDLIEMLRTGRWDTLDAQLSAYEMKAEKDPHFEMNAMAAFGAFDAGNPLIAAKLNDWVTAAPNSYAALVARATCEVAIAQRVRGNGPGEDVPTETQAAMDRELQAAVRDAKEAIKIHPNLAPAYALRIKAARIDGTGDQLARAKGDALSIGARQLRGARTDHVCAETTLGRYAPGNAATCGFVPVLCGAEPGDAVSQGMGFAG